MQAVCVWKVCWFKTSGTIFAKGRKEQQDGAISNNGAEHSTQLNNLACQKSIESFDSQHLQFYLWRCVVSLPFRPLLWYQDKVPAGTSQETARRAKLAKLRTIKQVLLNFSIPHFKACVKAEYFAEGLSKYLFTIGFLSSDWTMNHGIEKK